MDSINQFTLSLWTEGFCQCAPVELDPTYTAEQMVKKLLRAENGISHIQSSGAKSSTLLLTFPGRGGTTQKEKEEESAGGEQERKKNHTVGISHQSWPDFFLLLSSLCPSWRRVRRFLALFCEFFFQNFSTLVGYFLSKPCLEPLEEMHADTETQSVGCATGLQISSAE